MAWERNFEKRVLRVREKELKFQRLNYLIEVHTFMFPTQKQAVKLMRASG
jgi:hypothetical protein